MKNQNSRKVVAITGGVGGAKLALGLAQIVAAEDLTVIVNTGDDFHHLGLAISPDIDTLLYTLAGLSDPEKGWGRHDETWTFMRATAQLGGETWFQLGDADLALHVERTRRFEAGENLTQITTSLCRHFGIEPSVLPMSNDRVQTRVRSDDGWMAFQDYFVRQRCEPAVREINFHGASSASISDAALTALTDYNLGAVIICPSNPWLSIGPLLALPGMRGLLEHCRAPVIAVSPLIGGQAVKGPTAKLMQELQIEVSATSVARYYDGLIDAFMVDPVDNDTELPDGMKRVVEPIMMHTLQDKVRVAMACLAFAD